MADIQKTKDKMKQVTIKNDSLDSLDQETNRLTVIDNTDNVSATNTNTIHVEWSPENELIMVEWCDVAMCYKWLNTRAHSKYSYMNAWFTIPAIVLSTITGTASFAQTSLPIDYQAYAPMAIGTINIFIGILTTIQQYLKISELNEAHRVSAISWDKFARNIRIELAKRPEERMDAGHFLKLNRQEFDRLMETSPMIDAKIIDAFNTTLAGKEGTNKRKQFDALKKPDICDTIVSANETRHHWYKEFESKSQKDEKDEKELLKEKDNMIRAQRRKIKDSENKLTLFNMIALNSQKKKQEEEEAEQQRIKEEEEERLRRQIEEEEQQKRLLIEKGKQQELIQYFIENFVEQLGRNPLPEEIRTNFQGLEGKPVPDDVLDEFLATYSSDIILTV
jgi:hypothetical protein